MVCLYLVVTFLFITKIILFIQENSVRGEAGRLLDQSEHSITRHVTALDQSEDSITRHVTALTNQRLLSRHSGTAERT